MNHFASRSIPEINRWLRAEFTTRCISEALHKFEKNSHQNNKDKKVKQLRHIILAALFLIGCNETTQSQETNLDWRQKYGIDEGTGIITGEIVLEGPWEGDTAFVYLRDPLFHDSSNQTMYCVGIDTITSGPFLIKNIPLGDYAIITNDNVIIENNILKPVIHLYKSFDFSYQRYVTSIKRDTIAKFTDILKAPGEKYSLMVEGIHGIDILHFDEENVCLKYIPLNKNNY